MSKVGLLTKDEEKFFSNLAVDGMPVKGILKPVVKLAIPMLLRTADNKWGDLIPDPWQTYIEVLSSKVYLAMQDKVVTKEEADEIALHCAVVMNAEIDIPLIGEDDEAIIFLTFWKWMAGLLYTWVRKEATVE